MNKTCVITLWNVQGIDLDSAMLDAVMSRAAMSADNAATIDIYPAERIPLTALPYRNPGQLEWVMRVVYQTGGAITIGCLQRQPSAQVEFHS